MPAVVSDDIPAVLDRLGLPSLPEPLPAPMVDAHTHLDSVKDYARLRPIDSLAAAASVNVRHLVQIGCDVAGSEWAVRLAATHPQVVAAVGLHPNEVPELSIEALEQALETIDTLAGAGAHVRAIGEVGLDYFRTDPRGDEGKCAIERQRDAFARQVELAHAHHLTLAIHCRPAEGKVAKIAPDALADCADILDEVGWPERTIFHCFAGGPEYAERVLAAGAWLSFAGNITYPANKHMQAALDLAPADKLLAETDAPFLTPIPERGKRNGPYLIAHTVGYIADRRGADLAELCGQLSANAFAAYGGVWGLQAVDDEAEIVLQTEDNDG